ncbi:hypothetical protein NQZ68_035620 [Dissostichus eleginoides]|nr:hypothetical protein NQZ68_035620 [Dissostichus eleginoides]
MDHHWKALQTRGDGLKELSCLLSSETMQNLPWVLSEEGLRGLQSTILRKRQNITERKLPARACYLQVLSGAENVNFLHRASADDYDYDSMLLQPSRPSLCNHPFLHSGSKQLSYCYGTKQLSEINYFPGSKMGIQP